MGYYVDLASISIDSYKNKLASAYLPPSRMILRDRLDERFGYFKSIGIKNVKELLQILKIKDQFNEFSKVEYLSGNYLTILLREIKSTLPKPNKIKEFAEITNRTISELEKLGIKNTVHLFDRVLNAESRKELADSTGISDAEILELTKLTDLSRIKWVGTTFARMLYDIGTDTVEKASKVDPVDLHKKINLINKERKIYKGQIGLNDIKIFVNAAKELPLDIDYHEH